MEKMTNFNRPSVKHDLISKNLPKPERKFATDMNYGILASGNCLLTDIVDQLHEPSRKINSVDRLSRHLTKKTPIIALNTLSDADQKVVSQPSLLSLSMIAML